MALLIKLIRNGLGGLIAVIDLLTRGSKLKRTTGRQEQVEAEAANLSIYQFFACPFCIKTRRALHKLNLPIQTRDATKGSPYREELIQEGGKVQVPCLKIEEAGNVKWLYDSSEIIAYLEKRFA